MRSIRVNPGTVATPKGYAHAVRTEMAEAVWLHVSGQIAIDASGAVVGVGDLRRQTEQVYENLAAILEVNGATFADVVKTTTFLTTLDGIDGMREVRSRYLGEDPPASTAVQVVALVIPEGLIEVEAVAVVPA